MITVYRMQHLQDGRGPWRAGFSQFWVEEREDLDNLPAWYEFFGEAHARQLIIHAKDNGLYIGCACDTSEDLKRWFTPAECRVLKQHGYGTVAMEVDTVCINTGIQLVFERKQPLNLGVTPFQLYQDI